MKIQLVSYLYGLTNGERLKSTVEIMNESMCDLILFSGHTLGSVKDVERLRNRLSNKKVEAIIELKDINSSKLNNCLYHVKNDKVLNLFTNQLFARSSELKNNKELAARLLNELELKRKLKIKWNNLLILQCGELAILKNIQADGNRVEFQLSQDSKLNSGFKKVIKDVDIFLNPMHTPMGNQGKMSRRREFLS